jgi:hypothetical protein
MSIYSEILRIQQGKQDIIDALVEKGYEIDSSISISDIAEIIETSVPDSSQDSSVVIGEYVDYIINTADSQAYFNTGYVPLYTTVVRFSGTIIPDGGIAHGSFDVNANASSDNVYRLFGYSGSVYFDRVSNASLRIYGACDFNDEHVFEFGNYYIKVDSSTVVEDYTPITSSWVMSDDTPLCMYAGLYDGSVVGGYAKMGTKLYSFQILEPDAYGVPTLMHEYKPALDSSYQLCMYDTVTSTFLYAENGYFNYTYGARTGVKIYGSGSSPSQE